MSDRLVRLLVFLTALLFAAAAVLIGLIVTGDDEASVAVEDSVALSIESQSEPPDAVGGSDEPVPSSAPDPDPDPVPDPEPGDELPHEEWDEAYELVTGDSAVVPVPSAEAPVVVSLTDDGFEVNRDWWIASSRYVGPEGCRDSTRSVVDDPISLDLLDISDGWYACVDVDNFARFGQLRFITIEPVGFVVVEVKIWNFAPPVEAS